MPHTHPAVNPVALQRFLRSQTQAQLADEAGVSRDTIVQIEKGRTPRRAVARAVAAVLDLPTEALVPELKMGTPGGVTPGAPTTGAGDTHDLAAA